MTQNRPARPYSIRTWLIGSIGALLLVGIASGLVWLSHATAPKIGQDYEIGTVTCSPAGTVGAQTDMTVTNLTGDQLRVKVELEFRDLDGRLVDSDSTGWVEVGPRDSVRHREVTLIGAAELVRSCPVTEVRAQWS